MRRVIPHLQFIHCYVHCHALAAKTLFSKLKEKLETCAKIIDWIRSYVFGQRIFKLFYEDPGNQ